MLEEKVLRLNVPVLPGSSHTSSRIAILEACLAKLWLSVLTLVIGAAGPRDTHCSCCSS